MSDRYWRKIEDVENDIENAMQISSILLKLKGYDDDLSKIRDNENNIADNLGKINDNENNISNNLEKIDDISEFILKSDKDFEKTYNIGVQKFKFDKTNNYFTIIQKEIKHDFIKNSLLFIKNNIHYKYDDLLDDYHRCQHEYKIYDDNNNLIYKYLLNKDTYYNKNSDILNTKEEFCIFLKEDYNKIIILLELHRHNRHGFGNINLEIDDNNNYIKIEYIEKGFLDNSHLINLNTGSISTNLGKINTNTSSISSNLGKINTNTGSISTNLGKINTNTSSISSNLGKINTNESSISSNLGKINTNESSISSNLGKINTNTSSISSNLGKINTNTGSISTNLGKINTNTSSISSNLGKINTNTGSISSNLTKINDNTSDIEKINELNKNIKAFYNLDQIFIYDIEKGYQDVDKNNHFHIFEKEITYNFIKNSYLEIALKVLTEISNYVLIGFFQILCNFYDQDNNLFYTISLSTAAGSINRLSTIKSVFIVPINENMNKIKIDFFIAPKETQQNRSAKFTIQDINSNKIYIKYFQKTDEMSIKDIQDALDSVNSISTRVNNLEKSLYLKNLYNDIYHNNDVNIITNIFFDKTYNLNAKQNEFIEIYFKLLIKYEDVSNARHITTNFILYNMENGNELISYSYDNSDYISNSNTDILLNNAFYYNFNEDVNKLKIAITFTKRRSYVKISYSSINNNRLIIKHYTT